MKHTTHSEGGPGFPSTAWTAIHGAQQFHEAERRQALGRLFRVYWRPIYWTFRVDWNAEPEEAKDLTQAYITAFLEKELVDSVSEGEGRFRAFIKVTIKHFMLNQRRYMQRLKRGGGREIVRLEDFEDIEVQGPQSSETPRRLFERELMRSILRQSLEDLAERCEKEGRREQFELFETYYLAESQGEALRYEDLQPRFGLTIHQIKNRLAELRTRYRHIVLSYVHDGVSSESDLLREIREVFDA